MPPKPRVGTDELRKAPRTMQMIVQNRAGRTLTQFMKCLDGEDHYAIADKLESTLERRPNGSIEALVALLRKERKCSLGTLIVASKADLGNVIKRYTEASLEAGQQLTLIEFAKAMPTAARELMEQAAADVGQCRMCLGSGKLPGKQAGVPEGEWGPCWKCKGKGETKRLKKHFEYAVDTGLKALKILEPGKGTQVNVNQQVGIKVEGGGLFEKIVAYADHTSGPERILDVLPEGGEPQSGGTGEEARNTP